MEEIFDPSITESKESHSHLFNKESGKDILPDISYTLDTEEIHETPSIDIIPIEKLQYMSELNTKQNWSDKIADLFREAIHERNSNPSAIIPKTSWTERLDCLLKINISSLGKKFETLKRGLINAVTTSSTFLKTR